MSLNNLYAPSILKKRLRRLRLSLARKKASFLVLNPENRRYLSGFSPEDVSLVERSGALLITPQQAFVLTDARYREEAQECSPLMEPIIYKRSLVKELGTLLPALGIKRLLFEEDYLSVAHYKALKKELPSVAFEPSGKLVERLRECKSTEELQTLKKALGLAEDILRHIAPKIRAGVREREIAAEIIALSYKLAEGPSFPPIVAAGPHSARPHAEPSDCRLQSGQPLIIDMGVKFRGYCSDITRTFCVGGATSRFQEVFDLVYRAKKAAEATLRPGVEARVPDLEARRVFQEAGVERHFWHSLGHGVGLAIHEAPSLSFRNRKKLRANQVITIEPGLYFPDWGGVRLEDMVVLTGEGFERLNSLGLDTTLF